MKRIAALLGITIAMAMAAYSMRSNYERTGCVFIECEDRKP